MSQHSAMFGSLALLALPLAQNCSDPATPGAGFSVTSKLNRLITFSDGKTTRADIRYPSAVPGPCGWTVLVFFDFNARIQSGIDPELVIGQAIFAQCYYRDSALPTGVGLSDALHFVIGP